jgi:hypothetical protein
MLFTSYSHWLRRLDNPGNGGSCGHFNEASRISLAGFCRARNFLCGFSSWTGGRQMFQENFTALYRPQASKLFLELEIWSFSGAV